MAMWERWRRGLERTRRVIGARVQDLGQGEQRETLLEAVEEALLTADSGVEVVGEVRRRLAESPASGIQDAFLKAVADIAGRSEPLRWAEEGPTVWLLLGVNGAGKTTTAGKLALRARQEGRSVVIAAADTFRAAAVEQLSIWADRAGAEIVRGEDRQDPASVAFAAIERARAQGFDLVIVDTAGRLHTREGLLAELGKLYRALSRALPGAPHESILVIDGATGQNAIPQAEGFHGAAPITGICVTKLDGAARGGALLAVRRRMNLPIKLVGLGEGPEDLVDFNPEEYARAMAPDWP